MNLAGAKFFSDSNAIVVIWKTVVPVLAVVVVRLVFVPVFTYVPRFLFRQIRERDPYPPWQAPVMIAWTGIRGAVSLAAALALPQSVPGRDLIVFVTFCVILGTLVLQGLTLPLVVRAFGIEPDHLDEKEDAKARIKAADPDGFKRVQRAA